MGMRTKNINDNFVFQFIKFTPNNNTMSKCCGIKIYNSDSHFFLNWEREIVPKNSSTPCTQITVLTSHPLAHKMSPIRNQRPGVVKKYLFSQSNCWNKLPGDWNII